MASVIRVERQEREEENDDEKRKKESVEERKESLGKEKRTFSWKKGRGKDEKRDKKKRKGKRTNSEKDRKTEASGPKNFLARLAELGKGDETEETRGGWEGEWDFFVSCLGLLVGIGNIWRFPYMAYENGGGAFLIPYLTTVLICGLPMYLMEVYLGQYSGKSCVAVWSCVPLAKGLGIAWWIFTFVFVCYYNVIISYAIYYASASVGSVLPWSLCPGQFLCTSDNRSFDLFAASQLYFSKKVLDSSEGVWESGGIKWDLFVTLIIAWLIVLAGVFNGIRVTAKVLRLSATFSYAVLIFFFFYGISQPGAKNGIMFFIFPSWDKLFSFQTWTSAAGQMFYSLGVSTGSLVTVSSFNQFRHNVFNVLAGFVVFSQLGILALRMDLAVSQVAGRDFELIFVALPAALSLLSWPRLSSLFFFLMFFSVGLGTVLCMVENLVTGVSDVFPRFRIYNKRFYLCVCLSALVCSLGFVTRRGIHLLLVLDDYSGGITFFLLALCECLTLVWIYGMENISRDIDVMLGIDLGFYLKITLGMACPSVLLLLSVLDLVSEKPFAPTRRYTVWTDVVSGLLIAFTLIQIPLWAAVQVGRQKSRRWRKKLKKALLPSEDWGPQSTNALFE